MATISSPDDDLDLSVLNSLSLNDTNDQKKQSQNQTPTTSTNSDELDLSSLDDLFPKKIQPLSSPPSKITSGFGNREDPFGLGTRFHNGVDIPIALNTPINSLGKGTVIEVGDSGKKDYGRFVKVDYGGGLVLTYGHLNKAGVQTGDKITADAIVGLSGSTGRSKGPHLHIKAELNGKPVNPVDYFGSIHDVAIGALTTDDVVDDAKLDLSALDNLDENAVKAEEDKEQLDLSSVDQVGDFNIKDLKPLEEKPYVDRRTIEEEIAAGAASLHQPKIIGSNPNALVGDRVTTIIPVKGINRPDINTITDYWLGAIDSNYSQINQEYRAQTGKNLIEFNGDAEYTGDNKYKLSARMTKGATDLINAYINGRSKGGPQAGWEAAYFKSQEIKRDEQKVRDQVEAAKQANISILAEKHPYIKAAFNILSPATLINKEAIKSGVSQAGFADAQLVHNLRMLPEALYTLYRYGGDSQQYQDLINKDIETQKNLFSYQSEVKSPESISEKIGAGIVAGAISFPKYALAGSLGIGTLPTLAYVENLHRGNIEAAKAALPMALMIGATHGLDSFFNKGTELYITKEKNGVPHIERIEVSRGQGSAAPFTRFREARQYVDEWNDVTEPGTSILKNEIKDAFFSNAPVSIKSVSPLTRQLIMRGTNALLQGGSTLAAGQSLQDVASNLVVGLTFPVGKYKVGGLEEGHFGLIPYVPERAVEKLTPLQLGQKRVLVPITTAPKFDTGTQIIESDRRTLSTDPLAANLEKGWQARGEGQTLYLNLDTATLNLLDLRRMQKEGKLGGASIKESMARQMAVNSAINVLEKQIPREIQDYFEKNESLIRAGLRTNWEAIKAKEEYLGIIKLSNEPKIPEGVKENPDINLKETPIQRLNNVINRVGSIKDNPVAVAEAAKEVFGNTGESNKWITPDRALFAFDRLINTTSKGGVKLRSGLDLAAIGKDLVDGSKAIWDLTQISAFYLEDFYHRKIEPTSIELSNKFRIALGDIVKNFTDDDFQKLFVEGKRYLDSNIADPFFSKMKQDAVEKLPNRMTAEQAKNVLVQHKDEFEWTNGLSEFLENNKDKKINKQDLIDIIQKGQVRVEESIAQEADANKIKVISKQIRELQAEVDKRDSSVEASDDYVHETALLEEKIESLYEERDKIKFSQNDLKYSLSAYSSEKLELPGAKNSKEVKLISPVIDLKGQTYAEQAPQLRKLYTSPRWDEANVVAHYRANDRISIDNKRIYFGEEFQSDWNHDIREQGIKINWTPRDAYRFEELKDFQVKRELTNEERQELTSLAQKRGDISPRGVEPNPFMQHNWKELVLKRFLRDAAVAKDENGNYKYDAIGWTTARQQLERYGGILEGKDFIWQKNSDGTYTFGLKTADNVVNYHEMEHISLERFAELTTKEAADFVREQENKYNKENKELAGSKFQVEFEPPSGQFSLSETVELRSREGTYADYDVAYKNILSKIGKRFGAKYSERELLLGAEESHDWASGEDVMNAMGIKKSNQDTYWRSISQETRDKMIDDYRKGLLGHKERIHSLEITSSMRESLSKEGLPLYGTGGSEALKYPEVGARNKIVTADTFNSAREDLVQKLTGELYHGTGFEFDTAHATGRHSEGWTYFTNDLNYAKIVAEAAHEGTGKFHPKNARYTETPVVYSANKPPIKTPLDFRELGDGIFAFEDVTKLLADRGIEVPQDIKDGFAANKPHGDMVDFFSYKPFREFIRKAAVEKGYDGLIIRDLIESGKDSVIADSYIAFNPTPVSKSSVFNSGLNPDAFIDNIKLLYSGIKDLREFTQTLTERYGPEFDKYAEDFYWAIRDKAYEFKQKLSIKGDEWSDSLKQNEDSPAWQIRQFFKDEEGALKFPKFLRKDKIPELENYLKDPESHQHAIGLDIRAWMRGIALSQLSPEFAKIYDTMRTLQRVVSSYETTSINQLRSTKGIIKSKLDAPVAEAIYQGNEWINPTSGKREGKVWSYAELVSNFGLNTQQITAYENVRSAVDNVLNLRLEGKLYAVREKAAKLSDKLLMAAPGSAEELNLKTQLLDLTDAQSKMIKYYDDLKSSGYITLQRKGSIAVYLEDPAYAVGDPNRKIYNQFESRGQAVKWIEAQKAALGIPQNTVAGRMYDIRNLKDIALKEALTPSQFEDLVDRSGAHTNDTEIEKIRAEVYSKFPSFTYQLKREFVRGYDRDLQTAINSTVDQLELYASSFYSKVGREEGMKVLEATGIEKADPNLYRLSSSYIADETAASKLNWLSKAAITARRGTYLFQLGFDVNQLWMNAVAQPITQTYGYFYRITDPSGSGRQLTGLEPEHYFIKAAKETLNWRLGKSSTEFNDVVDRLVAERVLSPEFVHTLIESQTGTRKTSKVEHWASIFMREGEKQTRLHAAAEGFFVGKEKFGLAGDELINFITKAVDATQSNPTRGENPFVIRQLGEGGKLFYQFGAFNQMWWENLALGVKQSSGTIRKSLFLARELAPLAIMGGISALPLSMFAGTMYTLVTGRDPKKDWDKYLGDDTLIERLARYGISTSAAISRKISPQVPVFEGLLQTATSPTVDSLGDALSENIPFFATAEQLSRGIAQVAGGDYFKGIINLSPRALKGPLKMVQTSKKGYKAGENTILSRKRITPVQKAEQFFNISPTPVVEYYDTRRTKELRTVHRKLKKVF